MTTITIKIDFDSILERVCAESAWRAAHTDDVPLLTPDNARLIARHVTAGQADLRSRMSGFVSFWNWNPNIAADNLTIKLSLADGAPATIGDDLTPAIVELLAQHALMSFYGEQSSYHRTAWLKYRAQVMLMLARTTLP